MVVHTTSGHCAAASELARSNGASPSTAEYMVALSSHRSASGPLSPPLASAGLLRPLRQWA
jgi:hypothetical protein